ncbi:cytochrome c peroxidase [Pararhizobium sp. LjRoot235]|uniref:cytochrome c peroxidase n=1 Tax=Pararhizobium sp. LjRoot235 TaxID=3342291 RepID=UPI003F4FBE5D
MREKASLGKKLDPRLSATSTQSCASCHSSGIGWGDGLAVGVGHGMVRLSRRFPTIVNAAWGEVFMWTAARQASRTKTLAPFSSSARRTCRSSDRMFWRRAGRRSPFELRFLRRLYVSL